MQQSAYYIIEWLLFIMLIQINLSMRLKTQVMHNGQILVLAIDQFNKEIFRVQLKKQPKRKAKVKDPDANPDNQEEEDNEAYAVDAALIQRDSGGLINVGVDDPIIETGWVDIVEQDDKDTFTDSEDEKSEMATPVGL